RVRSALRVLEPRVRAELVLRPDGIVERERYARRTADPIERSRGADLAGRRLVRRRVRVQVVQHVQQRKAVHVFREVEQAAMRALDLRVPGVAARVFRGGRARGGERETRGRSRAEHSGEKAAPMSGRCSVHWDTLLNFSRDRTRTTPGTARA